MITPVVLKQKLTYEDYLKTPDDKSYELIEGELIMTPSPATYHQWISKNLEFELERYVRGKGIGRVFYAPYDVCLDNENVFQPDILFISEKRLSIIGAQNVQGAPDLVVEILSESTAYNDLIRKKKLYARFGVQEYWIVDPGEKSIELHSLEGGQFVLTNSFAEKDSFESRLLAGLKIDLPAVFAF